MPVWNLEDLRQSIKERYGVGQLDKAKSHINSVDWKIRAAGYHSHAASAAFSGVFENDHQQPLKVFKMMFSNGEDASNYRDARFVYEVNVIACAQAMHSVSDIISHVILDSLALDGFDENNLCLRDLQRIVPESKLKQAITRVIGIADYRYLQDFVNTSKHASLVDTQYSIDLTGEDKYPHGMKFMAFECKGRRHQAKWGEDFLRALRQLSIEYVQLGCSLNEYMRSF